MDSTIDLLKIGLDGAQQRQTAISNNIANVDTPNYKRKDVDFLSVLKKEAESIKSRSSRSLDEIDKAKKLSLSRTNSKHLNSSNELSTGFSSDISSDMRYRNDGNSVDIDHEMAELAKNNLYYSTLSQRISSKFNNINEAISKGGN